MHIVIPGDKWLIYPKLQALKHNNIVRWGQQDLKNTCALIVNK